MLDSFPNFDNYLTRDDDDEPREPACPECGGDAEGGHTVICSFSPDYAQPDVPAWMNEPNSFDDFNPRDEHDSPIDHDVEDL